MEHKGTRIKLIPFRKPPTTAALSLATLTGMLAFIALLGAAVYVSNAGQRHLTWKLLAGAIASWLLILIANLIHHRALRRNWVVIPAKCVDREVLLMNSSSGRTWGARWLCEFEINQMTIRSTPSHWRTFSTQESATRFGESVVNERGEISIWVNPENPRQTEIRGEDIYDWLMH
jgi:hypothetical protein